MGNYLNNRAAIAGAVCGIVLGCLTGIQFALAGPSPSSGGLQGTGDTLMLVGWAAYFLVGLLVRRHTDSVEMAVGAGIVAGIAAGATSCLAAIILGGSVAALYAGLLNLALQAGMGAGLSLLGALARRPQTAP